MASKYLKIILLEDRDDELCLPFPPEMCEAVRTERKARKQFREELNKEKMGVVNNDRDEEDLGGQRGITFILY